MGPLIPFEIISQGWALAIIFLIGIAFGLVLEQSGFSSSKKLVGVFYAYDFVVLKVFFTAGITAMVGIFFMNFFGWIDTNYVFINSNFLSTAIIGGVIMGLGFLLGGFCPGTSLTAAAIGKVDAFVFILGMFLGVLFFGLFFDTFSKLQTGLYFDGTLIFELLGMSKNSFIAMMILMALMAFGIGSYFENKAPDLLKPTNKAYNVYFPELTMAVIIALVIFFIPAENPKSVFEKNEKQLLNMLVENNFWVETEELAFNMMEKTDAFVIIDVRERDDFSAFHFENAVNLPLSSIWGRSWTETMKNNRHMKVLLVSNGGTDAAKAWLLCKRKNYDNVFVLNGGLNKFVYDIFFDNEKEISKNDYAKESKYRFRKEAAQYFSDLKNK